MASSDTYFVTFPNREKHEKLLRDTFEVILKGAVFEGIQRDQPVLRFQLPEDLKNTLDLSLPDSRVTDFDQLVKYVEQVIHHSVKTGHPHFVNQLYSG